MLDAAVLVLNRCFLPVHVTSARRAFVLLYQGVAKAVDERYDTFDFETWRVALGAPQRRVRRHRRRSHPHSARHPARALRSRAATTRALQPHEYLRARSQYMSVLRPSQDARRAEPGSRDPALAGGANDMGERRVQLRGVQSPQGRTHSSAGTDAALPSAAASALDADRGHGPPRTNAPRMGSFLIDPGCDGPEHRAG